MLVSALLSISDESRAMIIAQDHNRSYLIHSALMFGGELYCSAT